MLGYMPVPENFKYADVLRHGKPTHERRDIFAVKHPAMPLGKRAKIFSPFDALKGFSDAVEAKEEMYVARIELCEDECAELDSKLAVLQELVKNGRDARENSITVTVTHFVPCTDRNNDAYGCRGQYVDTNGCVTAIDPVVRKTLTVAGKRIRFADIADIRFEPEKRKIIQ
ncbi:MAG: hypothetical protein IJ784_10265 [Ruminiclostridium sp.]|nr:hypothetical protein [Ruminiclostridium sp.]